MAGPVVEGERLTCRCGKVVVIDHARRLSAHEFPTCEWYNEQLKQLGGNDLVGVFESTVIESKK